MANALKTKSRRATLSLVQLRTFIEQAPVALAMFDTNMCYLAVSDLWLSDYSLNGQSILGRSYYDIIPGIPERWREAHRRGLRGQVIRKEGDRFKRSDGSVRWLRWQVRPWHTLEGATGGLIIFSEDITNRNEPEEQQSIAALVSQASSEAMAVLDRKGVIISVNPAFTALTGYSADEAIGMNLATLLYQKDAFPDELSACLSATGSWKGVWKCRKNGEFFAVSMSINSIFGRDGSVDRRVALFTDITEQLKFRETIWRQANFDDLTDLPNRRMFKDRLDEAIKQAGRSKLPLALVLVDLDGFKEVNDTLGHEGGDALLTRVAARLRACVRESDTVARWGGDEFTLIVGELCDVKAVDRVARDVLKKLRAPFQLDCDPVYVSGSIGIAMYPSDAENAAQLIKNADHAMYESKYSGGDRISYFRSSVEAAALERAQLRTELRRALAAAHCNVHTFSHR